MRYFQSTTFFLNFTSEGTCLLFIKKKVEGKNKLTRDLSSSVVEKFNGYKITRHELAPKEKKEFTPINIIYEPVLNDKIPIPCFFTDQIHLAYRSYIAVVQKEKENIHSRTVKQCYYCESFFAMNEESMQSHLQVCAAKEGITYALDNGQILSFQENFKYLGDVPFTVSFDFETATTDSVFFDPKMFVISYYQIYSFHPALNLDKTVIFRSFQQSADEVCDLSHFEKEHVAFFNKATFYQLKDAASAVLARQKSSSLAELFLVELKFTVDTLNDWFSYTIKPRFFELNDIKKQIFMKENPIIPKKTMCSLCVFSLNVEEESWYDFVVECEHLFLRNTYSEEELKKK